MENQMSGYLHDSKDFSTFVDTQPFPFPCPYCGENLDQTIGWFKTNDQIVCSRCGRTITFNAKQLREILPALEEALYCLWISRTDLP
jgi:transcription elongation factor Elf1